MRQWFEFVQCPKRLKDGLAENAKKSIEYSKLNAKNGYRVFFLLKIPSHRFCDVSMAIKFMFLFILKSKGCFYTFKALKSSFGLPQIPHLPTTYI